MSKVETVVFLLQSIQYSIQSIIFDCEFPPEKINISPKYILSTSFTSNCSILFCLLEKHKNIGYKFNVQ